MWKFTEDGVTEVDRYGNVRRNGRYLKQCICRYGYRRVALAGKRVKYVHRLVAQAFLENPEGKATVNHKDGNKSNNIWSNLEWATNMEQMYHARDYKLMSAKLQFQCVEVFQYKTGDYVGRFDSQCQAARHLGISQSRVSAVLRGKRNHHKGYTFKLVDITVDLTSDS